jgi:hypothetical protein
VRVAQSDRQPRKAATAIRSRQRAAAPPARVTHDAIAHRAYDLYLTRGCEHGRDLDDWLQAERELQQAPRIPTA